MKKLSPILLFLFAASCSQRPPAGYQPWKPETRTTPPQAQPAHATTTTPAAAPAQSTAAKPSAAPNNPTPGTPAAIATNQIIANPAPVATNFTQISEIHPTNTATATPHGEDIIPAGTINFPATDLNQVLQIYSELVNRTVLRPANLPSPPITLKTQTPLTRKEAIDAFDAVLAMNGITMINIGDKFVKAVPTTQVLQEGAPFSKLDATQLPEVGQYVTHVVQLKYVKPSEMVQVLQPFAKIQGSILPVDSSQILVLRDYSENVKRMLEMIKSIDISVPSEFVSEVIPIKYAKAADIADALNSLSGGGGGTSVGRGTATGAGRTGVGLNRPGGMTGAGGVGGVGGVGGLGGYGNSTPFGGQPGVGGPGGQAGAPGTSFTDRLRNIIKSASSSGELQIIGQTKIISDERSNSLLIFASRPDMEMIKNIVAKLDVVLAQVLIETVILDVTLEKGWNVGVSAAQSPPANAAQNTGGMNVQHAGASNNGQPFIDFINSAATNAFALGALPGGFSYWGLVGQNFNVALQAAASDSHVNVVQTPQILTTHATPGQIFIGSTVPYITTSYYGGAYGSPGSSYQQMQVGIGLSVTPYINQDGLVVMEIEESIDEISGSINIQNVGPVPTTTSRKLSAEVAVRDGDSIVLGGFIRNSDTKSTSGVPILKDLPLLGVLFSQKSDSKERKELLVLMRPTVLRTPDLAAAKTADEKARMPGVREAEYEVKRDEKGLSDSQRQHEQLLDKQNKKSGADW